MRKAIRGAYRASSGFIANLQTLAMKWLITEGKDIVNGNLLPSLTMAHSLVEEFNAVFENIQQMPENDSLWEMLVRQLQQSASESCKECVCKCTQLLIIEAGRCETKGESIRSDHVLAIQLKF